MLSSHNILNPANGAPITVPSQDMVLGLYYLTKGRKSTPEHPVRGEGMKFYSAAEAIIAYNEGRLSKHAQIKVRVPVMDKNTGELSAKMIDTVTGKYKPRTRNILIGSAIVLYVLSPIDLIPGFLLDDAAIVLIAMKYFSREIDRYLAWEKQQKEKKEIIYTDAEIVDE